MILYFTVCIRFHRQKTNFVAFLGLICFVCFMQRGDLNGPQVRDTLGIKLSFMLHIIQTLKLKVIESLLRNED